MVNKKTIILVLITILSLNMVGCTKNDNLLDGINNEIGGISEMEDDEEIVSIKADEYYEEFEDYSEEEFDILASGYVFQEGQTLKPIFMDKNLYLSNSPFEYGTQLDDILRNPEQYKGHYLYLKGSVQQIIAEEGNQSALLVEIGDSYIVLRYTRNGTAPRILEDDSLLFYISIDGLTTLTNSLGQPSSFLMADVVNLYSINYSLSLISGVVDYEYQKLYTVGYSTALDIYNLATGEVDTIEIEDSRDVRIEDDNIVVSAFGTKYLVNRETGELKETNN
ncbi:hypothetical protein CIW83_18150 [Tissierella sp. P1]|uniref:hypothetical protein n=1 Tax=Tissierella sp. P1 TaxID=1280483 RepID=UPI000BA027CE|nr:hypothetical protein [Tissierella sp. P1]OZV10847.1 hypothetical protein CIW83_18150 [Tissierella sp. P1]